MLPLRLCAVCLLVSACARAQTQPPLRDQEQPPPAEQPAEEYFSGTVIAVATESVTVARTVLGKNVSSRRFVINSETQIEGKLRVKSRVTVQYVTRDEVDHALHIIVRTAGAKK